jgi:hypothetical protein
MGQVSLPRLEKINVSMSWESAIFYEKESWASPKLFLLHSLLSRYLFTKRLRTLNRAWLRALLRRNSCFHIRSVQKKYLKPGAWSLKTHRDLCILGRYLYQAGGKYSTVVLYTTRNSNQAVYTSLLAKIQQIAIIHGTQ